MSDLIGMVNALRQVAHTDLPARVRHVGVILCGSRGGSSLLARVLAGHPEVAAMDGEIDPFLALTRNGFGYNSHSDALTRLDNCKALADNVVDDLSVASSCAPGLDELRQRWTRRLLLQYPALFCQQDRLRRTLDQALEECGASGLAPEPDWLLARLFRDEPWRLNFYDGHADPASTRFFDQDDKIEEPPFVLPRSGRRRFQRRDAAAKLLLFKSPSDAYRIGIYEQLFPHAQVRYIHLCRGYAQSVNGLMDGWLSPRGFFAHDLRQAGSPLSIRGYSDRVLFGQRWWKFDLPPNWREFTRASLEEVCLNQWLSAHRAILASGVPALRVRFEDFLASPGQVCAEITRHLGLPALESEPALPVIMATEPPAARRWTKREQAMLALGERADVREMMERLGYAMEAATWQ
ncbi:hypothetical protein HSX11_11100 [Oxalobacteraceae bacterium]|nr:hypothetical protein [Oxalobacteraceae bacterium]